MATIILKNLYHNGEQVKEIIQNGDIIYVGAQKLVFDVDKDSISFEDTGGSTTITITANEKWTMTKPEWITASQTSGSSTAVITLSASAYATERTGDIVIACGGKTKTISVVQGRDYSKEYLTIEALEDGNILFGGSGLYFSKNEGEWGTGSNLDVSAGDRIRFKGNLPNANNMLQNNTLQMNVYGNIQSLFYGDNFEGQTTVKSSSYLFRRCTGLVDASNLVLPATTLIIFCYGSMFQNCTSLTTAPEFPATTLAESCYGNMFQNCTSLTAAPALPATTLAKSCYDNMFRTCTSLTAAPALPATTLVTNCYQYMFYDCTSLNYIKCLATDISASSSHSGWLGSVSPTGTFVKKAGVTWPTGDNGIPSGWTVIEE